MVRFLKYFSSLVASFNQIIRGRQEQRLIPFCSRCFSCLREADNVGESLCSIPEVGCLVKPGLCLLLAV